MPAKTSCIKTLALIFFGFSLTGVSSCAKKPANDEPSPVLSGPPSTAYPMPPLHGNKSLGAMGWALADGRHDTVSTYRNKVLVLDFYATWCEPCRDSIPHLIELQRQYGSQGLQIVGLNVGGFDDRDNVPEFAREFNIGYPLGIPDDDLSELLLSDSNAIPQTFILDRQGNPLKRYVGYSASVGRQIEADIKQALGSSE